jgi:histidinol-phosphate phosphatase family protein
MDPAHGDTRGRSVFLDRDGVLTEETGQYITDASELQLLPGAVEAVARLNRAGWRVYVITNQSGVGRGCMTECALARVHSRLVAEMADAGARIDGIYACPHHPDAGCDCRKPRPGLLLCAAAEHEIDLATAWFVGDSASDIAAGQAAGCHTLLVLTGHTTVYDPASFPAAHPETICQSLADAAEWIVAREQG